MEIQNISTKLNNFIKDIIQFEKDRNEDANFKYQFGECSNLVSYLFYLDNEKGEKIEINSENSIEEEYCTEEPSHHYIYKASNGKYYDINGEFEDLYDLSFESDVFEDYLIEEDVLNFVSYGQEILITKDRISFVESILN